MTKAEVWLAAWCATRHAGNNWSDCAESADKCVRDFEKRFIPESEFGAALKRPHVQPPNNPFYPPNQCHT